MPRFVKSESDCPAFADTSMKHKGISAISVGVKRGRILIHLQFSLKSESHRSQKPPWRLPKVAKPGNNWQCTLLPSLSTLQNNQLQNPLKGPIIKRRDEIKRKLLQTGQGMKIKRKTILSSSIQYSPLQTINASPAG